MASNAKNLAELLNNESTIAVADVADGSITTAKLADDAVTTAKIANKAVTSAKALNFGRRNLIINGAMIVAQRATSASVSDGSNEGYSTVDRFSFDYANNAGGTATVSQDTTVPSGYGFNHSIKVDVTGADTTLGATHMIMLRQRIEAQNIRNSGWDYTNSSSKITLSFWARSVKAGTYTVTLRATDVGFQYYPIEYTLAANTWKKVEASIPGDSSLVFNDDSEIGLDVRWHLAVGDDRNNGTANQWNGVTDGTEKAATSNQVNFFDDVANNFFLTGVQLEVGDTATDFEHRSFAEELALCRRYFQEISGAGAGTATGGNQTASAQSVANFPVQMRVAPTTITVGSTANTSNSGGSGGVGTASVTNYSLRYTASSSASGRQYWYVESVKLDAEL